MESGEMLELRGRMTAWGRSFASGHGRPPSELEWAAAARMVGGLPGSEADRLAQAAYAHFGHSAVGRPADPGFTPFAVAVLGPRRRAAIRRHGRPRRS